MAGVLGLRFIQLGKETTAGVSVAATTIWRGPGMLEDQREVQFQPEASGYLSGTDHTDIPVLLAALEMEDTPATFEQLPHVLEAGVKLVTTGTQDSTGSGYVYTYTFPTTARNTIRTYTIEGGDDQQEEEMEYAFVESFNLSGEGRGVVQMNATWVGRQATASTKTGSLALPTVEDILFGKGALYLDAVSGTMGTTQVSASLLGFEMEVNTGVHPIFTTDNLYFTVHELAQPEITMNLTFLHNASAVAEKANWRAETARKLRLQFAGSALTTAGNFTTKLLRIDLAGKWLDFEKIGEQDGDDVVTGVFRAAYNATAAHYAEIKVVNQVSVLP